MSYLQILTDIGVSVDAEIESLTQAANNAAAEREAALQEVRNLRADLDASTARIASLLAAVQDLQNQLAECEGPVATLKVGTTVARLGNESLQDAYDRRTREIGVEPEAVRVFYQAGPPTTWPNLGSAVEIVSFKYLPRDILDGKHDTALTTFFKSVPADGEEHVVCYWHEPEDNIAAGDFSALDYRLATQYIAALARRVTTPEQRLVVSQILMSWSMVPASGRNIENYFVPEVDAIGWDAYTNADTAELYATTAEYSRSKGKRYFIAEAGVRKVGQDANENARHVLEASAIAAGLGFEYFTYYDTRDWLFNTEVEWAAIREAIQRDLPLGTAL